MQKQYRDALWEKLQPHLPGQKGGGRGVAQDYRRFINAYSGSYVLRIPLRDHPHNTGDRSNTYCRFIRRHNNGVWEKLLDSLIDKSDFTWLMVDASPCCTRMLQTQNVVTGTRGVQKGVYLKIAF